MVRKATNDKAMEDALQAAVARMSNGSSSAPQSAMAGLDPIGLLMTVLPKLLESKDGSGDLNERLDELAKDELQPLRQQLAEQAKLLERIYSAQRVLLRELRAVQTVQSAIGGAVSNLTEQMARVELIGDPPNEGSDYSDGMSNIGDLGFAGAALRGRGRPAPRKR